MDSKNQIVIYKSPLKAIWLLLLCSLFVLPSIWMIISENDSRSIFYFCAGFFGLGYIVSIFNLFDRRPQIIITKNGIINRSIRKEIILWDFIKNAYLLTINKQHFICLVTEAKTKKKKTSTGWSVNLNKAFGAQEINLNTSLLKVNKQKLLGLINELIVNNEEQRDLIIIKYKLP